ncbi:MAG TPA: nuclear transport factor 2 family protein [Chryseosolibacter sp.]|nr:nuclear transport factor 2 family protein [Chryseosolibacter sp.]
MKYIVFILTLLVAFRANSQDPDNPAIQMILESERAFSRMSQEKNARDAFHAFLSEHAVTFDPEPKIGLKHFESRIPNSSLLTWQPEYCDISASGDLGYVIGPWQLLTDRSDTHPSAIGHFLSIWSKQTDGTWKVALDIGVSHGEAHDTIRSVQTSSIKPVKVRRGDFHAITAIEEKFITDFEEVGNKVYEESGSEELRIYRTAKLPATTAPDIAEYIKSETAQIDFQVMGGALSKSRDLAYVYGTATIKTSKDQHIKTAKGSYVRIWKKEDGDHWKIVVDILSQG